METRLLVSSVAVLKGCTPISKLLEIEEQMIKCFFRYPSFFYLLGIVLEHSSRVSRAYLYYMVERVGEGGGGERGGKRDNGGLRTR